MTFVEDLVDNLRDIVIDHLSEADLPGASSISSVVFNREGDIIVGVDTGRRTIQVSIKFSVLTDG